MVDSDHEGIVAKRVDSPNRGATQHLAEDQEPRLLYTRAVEGRGYDRSEKGKSLSRGTNPIVRRHLDPVVLQRVGDASARKQTKIKRSRGQAGLLRDH